MEHPWDVIWFLSIAHVQCQRMNMRTVCCETESQRVYFFLTMHFHILHLADVIVHFWRSAQLTLQTGTGYTWQVKKKQVDTYIDRYTVPIKSIKPTFPLLLLLWMNSTFCQKNYKSKIFSVKVKTDYCKEMSIDSKYIM